MIFSIAVDGPSGAGKSSIAKVVSKKLNIAYLDTGAMYRALALHCLDSNVDISSEVNVRKSLENVEVNIFWNEEGQVTKLKDIDVSKKIRNEDVGNMASAIAIYRCVRETLVKEQRKIAKQNSIIVDGRDIGTDVLPDADIKIYLDASVEIRAKRRYEELTKSQIEIDFESILEDIVKRDYQDKNREIAPLRKAEDAVYIDTSNMKLNEVVDKILSIVSEVLGHNI